MSLDPRPAEGAGRPESPVLCWSMVLAGVAAFSVHSILVRGWMLDDAFIFFRYAENLSLGKGLVFNPGERVEGYTSFLWVVLMAAGSKLGLGPVLFSRVLGVLSSLGAVLLLGHSHRFVKGVSPVQAAAGALLLGTFGVFTPWAMSGMEVSLFTLLVLLSVLLYVRARDRSDRPGPWLLVGLVLGLLVLARPEGLLVAALLWVSRLVASIRRRNLSVLWLGLPLVAVVGSHLGWRILYYGHPLPNTFYAKVGTRAAQLVRGLEYLGRFGIPAFLLAGSGLASIATGRWFRRYSGLGLLPLLVLVFALYPVAVGGDCMPAFRFMAPVTPVLALVAALSVWSLARSTKAVLLVLAVFVVYNLAQARFNPDIRDRIAEDRVAFWGKRVGLWFRQNTSEDAVIATNTAGTIPYYSQRRIIDMLGATDAHIAHRRMPDMGLGWPGHEKYDGSYVLLREPDYIQLGSSLGSLAPFFPSDSELWQMPAFRRNYRPVLHELDSASVFVVCERKQGLGNRQPGGRSHQGPGH